MLALVLCFFLCALVVCVCVCVCASFYGYGTVMGLGWHSAEKRREYTKTSASSVAFMNNEQEKE